LRIHACWIWPNRSKPWRRELLRVPLLPSGKLLTT